MLSSPSALMHSWSLLQGDNTASSVGPCTLYRNHVTTNIHRISERKKNWTLCYFIILLTATNCMKISRSTRCLLWIWNKCLWLINYSLRILLWLIDWKLLCEQAQNKIYFNATIKLRYDILQQMFKMSAVCSSDTSSRSESTGRRSGLWRSCSSAIRRSGNF